MPVTKFEYENVSRVVSIPDCAANLTHLVVSYIRQPNVGKNYSTFVS